ncbi:MAG TPA: glycosyltransferase family 2 protein [Turneriella sp.]|nr:glycosyltransferase family 2 protein [Turneriella sp.]
MAKIVGFTFIRNAIEYDYPIRESILSLLPLVDKVVVAVGKSKDDTLRLVRGIDKNKIHIIETVWDDSKREGGRVLAEETQKAYNEVIADKWAFYIQGDEVLHEADYPRIREALVFYEDNPHVDGLLFKYRHFYGSYDYVGSSRRWYRREIRVVRPPRFALAPQLKIYSYKDAQGFRKNENQKLRVKEIDAHVHHYGWVKPPEAQMKKQQTFHKLWHDDSWMQQNIPKAAEFDYSGIDALEHFTGTHPKVMQERIREKNWRFDFDISRSTYSVKEKISRWVERYTGYRPGEYKNYVKV